MRDFDRLVDDPDSVLHDQEPPSMPAAGDEGGQPDGASQVLTADLVAMAEEGELFHTPDGVPYVTFDVDGHQETWRVRSSSFGELLAQRYYSLTGRPPRSQALRDAVDTIAGLATYGGDIREVHLRIAGVDGRIYLDLCDEQWRAIEIGPDGWRLVSDVPIRFRRTRSMLPLPIPVKGGLLNDLRGLINVTDDSTWRLVLGWLLFAFSPEGPYPILVVHGEQGSAKSVLQKLLRALIDPSRSPLRAAPRDQDSLMVACVNEWVIAFDNLSSIQDWLSDALCRVASGGGLAKRRLYSDDDEIILQASRPVMLNGINDLATRGDLLDRALLIDLEPIPAAERRTERQLLDEFERYRPSILGALFDVVAAALRGRADVRLDRLPRMADFAVFVTAAEGAFGWAPGSFMEAYSANRRSGHELALDAAVAGGALRRFMARHVEWTGTAEELRDELEEYAEDRDTRSKFWPGNGWAMGNALNRLAPNLRAMGIEVERHREPGGNRRRLITLRKGQEDADRQEASVDPSMPSEPGT